MNLANRGGEQMNAIWKYELDVTDSQTIYLPAGAEILTVQVQYEEPCLWAIVDTEAAREPRFISTIGTGHQAKPDIKDYIGTYQLSSGELVFHVFEVKVVDK